MIAVLAVGGEGLSGSASSPASNGAGAQGDGFGRELVRGQLSFQDGEDELLSRPRAESSRAFQFGGANLLPRGLEDDVVDQAGAPDVDGEGD